MKAYVIREFTGIEAICEEEIPKPLPQASEVLIQVEAAGINPIDWKISEGYLKDRLPYTLPITLGWDAAGTIIECGKDVHAFKKGEKVFAYTRKDQVRDGSFSEFITVPSRAVAPMPKNCSFVQAASLPIASLTAWQALFDWAHLQPNETILIHAGAGGVGGFAIQFAKKIDAEVITTARKENHPYVHSLGADLVIDYTRDDFAQIIRKNYPEGVDVVFDCIGGDTQEKSFSIIRRGGRHISIVQMPDTEEAAKRGIHAGYLFVQGDGEELNMIKTLLEQDEIQMPAIEVVEWPDLKQALHKSHQGHTQGKLVLQIR